MNETLLEEVDDTPTLDPSKNYLQDLVGEGKKFKTLEDLARGKYEADIHIKLLEKKSDQQREDYIKLSDEYNARAKLEELIDQMSKQQPITSSEHTQSERSQERPGIDPNEIESLVSKKIQDYEVSKRQSENFNTVKNKLKERFGPNYQAAVKEQIDALGLSEEDINALARKSPTAVFRQLGLDQPEQRDTFQAPPRSSRMSDSFKPTTQKRTWTYYQNLKKTNPRLYSDPKITNQMHADYAELGKAFEDGDFHAV